MKRRTFIKTTAVTPIAASGVVTAQEERSVIDNLSDGYFDALPETKANRNSTVIECANELCSTRKAISEDVLNTVVNGGDSASDVVRRLQYGVRILNEYNITDKIDESMIKTGRRDIGDYTRYLPLVGSFNNLCEAACAVETPDSNPEAVKDFLFATAAFGLEVALWTIGTPYKMAWSGTRFIANRTFLRFARHGCRGCIALLMSELHWAIRGSIYGEVVTESNVEFVWDQIQDLKTKAEDINYDVDLNFTYEEIQELVGSEGGGAVGIFHQEKEGPIERLIPDIEIPDFDFSIDLPNLDDLLT